jgi:DNA-binding NtrC family response regulator
VKEIAFAGRIVSATHRDLRAAINAGTFRLDLYYRIAIIALKVPPLRERPEDIPLLVEHFLREAGAPLSSLVSDAAMAMLQAQTWPGNVRELRNTIEALLAMGELPPPMPPDAGSLATDPIAASLSLTYKQAREAVLRAFEGRYVEHIVNAAGGNIAKAARDADMDRSHLMDLMRRLGLR